MKVNDLHLLEKMKNIIFHDGDVRPVWVGPGLGETDVREHKNYSKWANEHWGLYRAFLNEVKDNSEILDLGCGVGFCTINLSDRFKKSRIYGYDIDEKSVDFAVEYNINDNVKYICGDILVNKLLPSDYIFLVETLEHIKHEYHYRLIDNCLDSLNENGLLFISTPNEQAFSDADRGHVGILTNKFFEEFKVKYEKNIISIEYYDNTKLLDVDVKNYTNTINGSHFKIILKK
jgi:2-polyprenyl-3-methyl-5-hydroxy-6-metoxy-1,4-benzoquinol methylase